MSDLLKDETTALDRHERKLLEDMEKRIELGMRHFVRVGQALAVIREGRLYRESHPTFEAYCQERFELGRRQADRLVAASNFVNKISPSGLILPKNENQVREILSLPEEVQEEAWRKVEEEATKNNGQVTGAIVREVVAEFRPGREESERSEPPALPDTFPLRTLREAAELMGVNLGFWRHLDDAKGFKGGFENGAIRIAHESLLPEVLLLPSVRDGLFCLYSGLMAVYVGPSPLDFYEAFVGLGDIWGRQEVGDE